MSILRDVTIGLARCILGDSREIAPTLPRPAAVISDPPFGMKWDTNCRRFSGSTPEIQARRGEGGRDWGAPIAGDDEPFDPEPWLAMDVPTVLFGANHFGARLPVGTTLVWIKRLDDAFGTFLSDAEVAWMRGGHGVYCRRDTSMKAIERERSHPSQKPVGLLQWCIEKARVPAGGTILDPYAGSGSTIVAAVTMGYPAIGIEIEPRYYETMLRRVEAAQRQGDLLRDAPSGSEPYPRWAQAGLL